MAKQVKITIAADVTDLRRQVQSSLSNLQVNISNQSLNALNQKLSSVTGGGSGGSGSGSNISQVISQQKNLTQSSNQVAQATNNIAVAAKKATEEVKTFGERLGFATSRLAAYLIPASAFFQLTNAISTASTKVVQIDAEVNRLSQSMGNNSRAAQELASKVFKIGQSYGQSGQELLKITNILSRTGLFSAQKDLESVVNTLASAQLTSGFEKIGDSIEDMTAALTAFNKTGKDTAGAFKDILDVVAKLSSKSSVGASELLGAVKFAGPNFADLGGSPEQFFSLVASAKQLTRRSTTSVSSALGTSITALLRPENISYFQRLTGPQGGITNKNGDVKDFTSVLQAIAKATQNSSEGELSGVVKRLGGSGESSIIVSLIRDLQKGSNSQTLQFQDAANNSGGTIAKNAKEALNTIDVQLKSMAASFDEAFRKIGEDGTIKDAVKQFSSLSQSAARLVGTLGPLLPIFAALAAVKATQIAANHAPEFFSGLTGRQSKTPGASFIRSNGGILKFNGPADEINEFSTHSLKSSLFSKADANQFSSEYGNLIRDEGKFYYLNKTTAPGGKFQFVPEEVKRRLSLRDEVSEKIQAAKNSYASAQKNLQLNAQTIHQAENGTFDIYGKQIDPGLDAATARRDQIIRKQTPILDRAGLVNRNYIGVKKDIDDQRIVFNDELINRFLIAGPGRKAGVVGRRTQELLANNNVDPKYIAQFRKQNRGVTTGIYQGAARLQANDEVANNSINFGNYFNKTTVNHAVANASKYAGSLQGELEFQNKIRPMLDRLDKLNKLYDNLINSTKGEDQERKALNAEIKSLTSAIKKAKDAQQQQALLLKESESQLTLRGRAGIIAGAIGGRVGAAGRVVGGLIKNTASTTIPLAASALLEYGSNAILSGKEQYNPDADNINDFYAKVGRNNSRNTQAGVISSAGYGLITGGSIGSVGGPIGVAVGAGVGAIIGGAAGYISSMSNNAKEASDALADLANRAKDPLARGKATADLINNNSVTVTSDRVSVSNDKLKEVLDAYTSQYVELFKKEGKEKADQSFGQILDRQFGSAKGIDDKSFLISQYVNTTAKPQLDELAKGIDRVNQVLKNAAPAFDKFFFNFREENQSRSTGVAVGQFRNSLDSQTISSAFGRGGSFGIPQGIPEILLGQINRQVNGLTFKDGQGAIDSIVKNRTSGFLNGKEQGVFSDVFRVQSFGRDIIKEAIAASSGQLKDAGSSSEIASALQKSISDSINNNKGFFKSNEGREEAEKQFRLIAEKIAKDSPEKFKNLDPQALLEQIFELYNPQKALLDRFNTVLGETINKIDESNRALSIFSSFLDKSNEYEQRNTEFAISRVRDAKAVGLNDRDAASLLKNEIGSREKIRLSERTNDLNQATLSYIQASNDVSSNVGEENNSDSVGNSIQRQAEAYNTLSAEQAKYQYNLSRTNDVLALTRESFETLQRIVQANIESSKRIGQASTSDRLKERLFAGVGAISLDPLVKELDKYHITGVEGLSKLKPEDRDRILKQASAIGSNPLFNQKIFPSSDLFNNRLIGSGNLSFGAVKDITRFATGVSTGVTGLRDDTLESLKNVGKGYLDVGEIEQDQLDALNSILRVLSIGFNQQIRQFATTGQKSIDISTIPDVTIEGVTSHRISNQTPKSPAEKTQSKAQSYNIDVKADVNINGFENAGKDATAVAVVTSVMGKMSTLLKQAGDPQSAQLAGVIDTASSQVLSGFKSGGKVGSK